MFFFFSSSRLYMLCFRVPLACSYIPCSDVNLPASFMMQIQITKVFKRCSVDTTYGLRVALVSLLSFEGFPNILSVVLECRDIVPTFLIASRASQIDSSVFRVLFISLVKCVRLELKNYVIEHFRRYLVKLFFFIT